MLHLYRFAVKGHFVRLVTPLTASLKVLFSVQEVQGTSLHYHAGIYALLFLNSVQVICRVLSGVCMFICMTLSDPCTALRFLYETFCVFLYVCLPFLSYAVPMPAPTKARR